jgi:hypothetical protein
MRIAEKKFKEKIWAPFSLYYYLPSSSKGALKSCMNLVNVGFEFYYRKASFYFHSLSLHQHTL